jgi:calpain-7
MSSLPDLYQQVFQSLELGQQSESRNDYQVAQTQYSQSCQIFQQIIRYETDMQKQQLMRSQCHYYQQKIQQLGFLIQGNQFFESAISLEERKGDMSEVEKLYLQAADLLMKYLKLNEDPKIKSRVILILGRVEEIKAMCSSTDLKTLDLPTVDPNGALKMKPMNSTNSTPTMASPPPPSTPSPTSPPLAQSSDSLTPEEISVLRHSSFINGKCFQPWINGEESREKFRFDSPFCDSDGLLPLSQSQKQHHGIFMRPHEFLNPNQQPPVVIRTITPLAVTQDLVADCSFVCSLCIASAFEARHNNLRLITSLIYPQNNRGIPIYNPSGKYLVKLFYNGVYRKVVIDDRLPVTENTKRLLCSASKDPTELWVSLVEKAYMKLNGGYDFPGSNSGIDLHALTGWIPEQVFFEEDSSRPKSTSDQTRPTSVDFRQSEDRTWQRILSAHKFGDCLITISTGSLSPEEEERTGLVGGHAYAVLNVQSAGILRMLQVRNPWARQTWKGRFSSRDRDRWTPGLLAALNVKPEDFDKMDDEGIFWIDFTDCRTYFKSFFLNCNLLS